MKKTFLLLSLFAATLASAQTAHWKQFSNGFGMNHITPVSSGGFITSGNDSNYRPQLIYWDNNYNHLWDLTITSTALTATQYTSKVVEANDGNFFYMNASSESTGSVSVNKISPTGTVIWQKYYSVPSGNIQAFAMSKGCAGDNGFLFGGGQCSLSGYVIKCDQDGNITWQNQYLYPLSTGVITCFNIIPEGDHYVVGNSYNVNGLINFKIDNSGNVLSQRTYSKTTQIVPWQLIPLANTGGYAIMGGTNNSINTDEWVAVLDSNLAMTSFINLTAGYQQFTLTDIVATAGGANIVAVGNMYDGSYFYSYAMSLTQSGTINWKEMTLGNTTTSFKNVEFDAAMALPGDGIFTTGRGIYEGCTMTVLDNMGMGICNTVNPTITAANLTLTPHTEAIIPIAANAVVNTSSYTTTTGVNDQRHVYCGTIPTAITDLDTRTEFNIYPNPALDQVTIEAQGGISNNSQLTITSIDGRIVWSSAISAKQTISTGNWQSGVYFVTIQSGAQRQSYKLEVIH